MKIIRNNYLPLPGYKAMNFMGIILFVRGKAKIDKVAMNHELIHSAQWRELGYLGFLLWYVIEYLIHLARFKNHYLAYRRISFEREAYTHQTNINYLESRDGYSFLNYIS